MIKPMKCAKCGHLVMIAKTSDMGWCVYCVGFVGNICHAKAYGRTRLGAILRWNWLQWRARRKMKGEKIMKFWQYTEPYRVTIMAKDEQEANKIYVENVDERDEISERPKEITKEDAQKKWESRDMKEVGDPTFEERIKQRARVLLVDSDLL